MAVAKHTASYAGVYSNVVVALFDELPLRIQWLMYRYDLIASPDEFEPKWAGEGYGGACGDFYPQADVDGYDETFDEHAVAEKAPWRARTQWTGSPSSIASRALIAVR